MRTPLLGLVEHLGRVAALVACVSVIAARAAQAQGPDTACSYERCGLNIVPRLMALDVVKGAGETRVASLAFLVPHRVTAAFDGNDLARHRAEHAFRLRRVAAVLTDAGAIIAISAGVRAAATSKARGGSLAAAAAGTAIIASSIPIHFAADGELSRAVWEYNRRFTR
jgi:hypothetical protein